MARLKVQGMCMRGSLAELRSPGNDLKRRNANWWPRKVTIVPNLCLPERSNEIRNWTPVEDIRSLRLITGIKTPYLDDGRLDLKAYDSLIEMQIAQGVEGFIVGSAVREGHLMSWDEHITLIGHTVTRFGSSLKVISNTGSNSTGEEMQSTEQGFAVGMHASLHINPYYGKTSIPGLLAHFDSVLPMCPMIIYNMPSRTSQDITPSVIQTLAASPNFVGVKECVGYDRVRQYGEEGITVWCGMDYESHDARWDLGATGAMLVASNLTPGLVRELLMPLIEMPFHEPAPIGFNTAPAQVRVVKPIFRLPYLPLPLSKRQEFVGLVKDIGREHFVGEREVQVLDDDDFILVASY
ncbi:hypothetical protein ACJRO7_020177 [Eucalyptus globulus]|uniref:4-hydroxy-tetrahydrodipicolinate synthase n=1 Tax=Eucalyptus globulus TaxID=34317 RepID=A0ABD3KHW7_EUCGL